MEFDFMINVNISKDNLLEQFINSLNIYKNALSFGEGVPRMRRINSQKQTYANNLDETLKITAVNDVKVLGRTIKKLVKPTKAHKKILESYISKKKTSKKKTSKKKSTKRKQQKRKIKY